MIDLLQTVISALPSNQSELVRVQDCYPGFVHWNKVWYQSYIDNKITKPDLCATEYVLQKLGEIVKRY